MSSIAPAPSRIQKKTWTAILVFVTLFTLLFQYRILSLANKLATNVMPIGTKLPFTFDFQHAPQWLLPFYYTLDYLNVVWFTTVLGLFIAGAAITFLPGYVNSRLGGEGLKDHLAGVLFGIPNMFCTCCAATTLPGLRKAGASPGATMAFFVSAPALNIVVLLLAFQLLPLNLAIARVLLGLVAALGVTYAVAKASPTPRIDASSGACPVPEQESVANLISAWLGNVWGGAKVAVPLLVVGILIISVVKTVLPYEVIAQHLGDGLLPTVVAALMGTLPMVPTFTEVLWVGEFTKQGMGIGPATALLVTLPSVSLPSLWVLGRVYRSYRMAALLGASIFVLGIAGGIIVSTI